MSIAAIRTDNTHAVHIRNAKYIASVIWVVGVCLSLIGCSSPSIDIEALKRRVDNSTPSWQSYQEDIKGQIGAMAVAQWVGEPIKAELTGGEVHLTFKLDGKWIEYKTEIPILLKEPMGGTHRNNAARNNGNEVEYIFELPKDVAGAKLPWVEIQYPHTKKRIALNSKGLWHS